MFEKRSLFSLNPLSILPDWLITGLLLLSDRRVVTGIPVMNTPVPTYTCDRQCWMPVSN